MMNWAGLFTIDHSPLTIDHSAFQLWQKKQS
jgi:hypothetical protein